MSDEEANQQEEAVDGRAVADGDWLLSVLVRLANKADGEDGLLGITLFTTAGTFAGMLTANRRWLAALREVITNAEGGGGEGVANGLQVVDGYMARSNDDEDSSIEFIHLQEAFQLRGTDWVPLAPSRLWRGTFSEVTGWTLGKPR